MYNHLCSELEINRLTASQLHVRTLQTLHTNWSTFRSSETCLFCIRRKAEHPLWCTHAICDTCACIFGARRHEMEYSFSISQCILCQSTGKLPLRLKPPTAGTRLLVLDGGGIRGAFTLQVLHALDRHLQLPYPIYDEFDLALGTSTGKLCKLKSLHLSGTYSNTRGLDCTYVPHAPEHTRMHHHI